ncbi:unnamed protein product [Danaus chrysippus]|uniref:(African queen) hypothetical protein n=1 Tax=Danaus chrysippus TaxID=151541 RepID=A0A8J2RDU2_9NEOP|nr:unnamed protein product [Danaus chrysippus]
MLQLIQGEKSNDHNVNYVVTLIKPARWIDEPTATATLDTIHLVTVPPENTHTHTHTDIHTQTSIESQELDYSVVLKTIRSRPRKVGGKDVSVLSQCEVYQVLRVPPPFPSNDLLELNN